MPIAETDAVNATAVVRYFGASSEHGAGEALLKDAALLQSLGVPAATARALVSDLTQFKAP
ncbi:MAG TPA: hypothetical protein VGG89_05590 [Candidatus Baltobacteraceae bacterium]|jgi:hypothetical protein